MKIKDIIERATANFNTKTKEDIHNSWSLLLYRELYPEEFNEPLPYGWVVNSKEEEKLIKDALCIGGIEMNNEPVAWINRKGKDGEHGYLEWDKDDEAEINTPLYTHQYERPHNTVLVPSDRLAEIQAEIEKLRNWVEMLVEVPFFNAIDHYRGIPVAILRKVQEK